MYEFHRNPNCWTDLGENEKVVLESGKVLGGGL